MQVDFETRVPEARPWQQDIVQRARQRLARRADQLSRLRVQLSDQNGPRGGVDKRCQLLLITTDGEALHCSGQAVGWPAALDLALRRAQGLLRRQGQDHGRHWPRARRLALTAPDTLSSPS
jgi:hypothetical protein